MGYPTRLMVVLTAFLANASAFAYIENAKMPVCLYGPEEMKVDNEQVLGYKTETQNQFKARGFVSGTLDGPIKKDGDHFKFILRIGAGPRDTVEIIYNKSFGSLPPTNPGMKITVCGDYITARAPSGGYQASPAGALIHWVHYNPGNRSSSRLHEHGFIMFGSNLAGFDEAPERAWTGHVTRRN